MGYLNLEDVQEFLLSSNLTIADSVRKLLTSLQIKGSVQDISFVFPAPWNDWNHLKLEADFTHLHMNRYQSLPGIVNLSGSLKWDGSKGTVSLNSHQAVFQYPAMLDIPLSLD